MLPRGSGRARKPGTPEIPTTCLVTQMDKIKAAN